MSIDVVNMALGVLVILLVLGLLLGVVEKTGYTLLFCAGTAMAVLNMVRLKQASGRFFLFLTAAGILLIFTILSLLFTGGSFGF